MDRITVRYSAGLLGEEHETQIPVADLSCAALRGFAVWCARTANASYHMTSEDRPTREQVDLALANLGADATTHA